MKKSVLFLLLTSALFADNNHRPVNHGGQWAPNARDWKTTFSVGPGYRRDRQKFICPADQSAYYYRDFNTVLASSSLVFSWERLLLKFAADYGWLVNGELDSKFSPSALLPVEKFPDLKMGSGYSLDIDGALACRIKFWTFGNGSFSFIPALGYIYSHFNAFPRGTSSATVSSDTTTNWIVFTMTRPIQQDWFGPYAEGRIAFAWKDAWRCDFYYQYIPIHFRQTFTSSIDDFNALLFSTATLSRESDKGKSTRTQLGGADISYRSRDHWQLGAHFKGSCTWGDTVDRIQHQKIDTYSSSLSFTRNTVKEKLKVQWIRYDINFYSSYWF